MREVRLMVSDDWMDFALCKEMPADVFVPQENDELAILNAKNVCMQCPVTDPCLEMGMKMRHGIWGGLTAEERMMLRSLE